MKLMISRYITTERHHKQCHRSILTTNLYPELKKKIEQKRLVISQTFINLSYKKKTTLYELYMILSWNKPQNQYLYK